MTDTSEAVTMGAVLLPALCSPLRRVCGLLVADLLSLWALLLAALAYEIELAISTTTCMAVIVTRMHRTRCHGYGH